MILKLQTKFQEGTSFVKWFYWNSSRNILHPLSRNNQKVPNTDKTFYSLLINAVHELIEEHKKNHNGDKPKDFIDHFSVEMLNSSAELYGEDQEDQLRTLIIDIVAVNCFFFLSVKIRF